MKKLLYTTFLILITLLITPKQILSETEFNSYMKDYYSKSNKASKILKEIENNLREGSRHQACSKQREAAKLGLLANQSLIRAFELEGFEPPMYKIKASTKRWESILNQC